MYQQQEKQGKKIGFFFFFSELVKQEKFMGKKRKTVWQVGPLYLFWVIWKARNKIAFEDSVLSIQRLKAFFVYLFTVVGDQIMDKRWSFDLNNFIDWVGLR